MAIGISAAAVMAAGSATAIAGDEDPVLTVAITATKTSVTADKSVTLVTNPTATASASDLVVTKFTIVQSRDRGAHITGGCTPAASAGTEAEGGADGDAGANACALVDGDKKLRPVESTLSLTEQDSRDTVEVKVNVTISGTVGGKKLTAESTKAAIVRFTPVDPSPDPDPSKEPGGGGGKNTSSHPTKPPKSTSKSPSSSTSGSGGSSKSSGGSGGSGGSSSNPTTGGVIPPAPNSSFDPRNPQVALPPIAPPGAQDPSVAPTPDMTPQSRLQGNQAPVAQDLTFERMARTQIAWLAALLVAFSLLLTQLRLGRRRLPAGAAAAAKKTKGTHRRPRRGVFGK
jgi:uncharacterized membrane protein YgcG